MFIELQTAKNERVSVNVDKVLFFAETKKGAIVILDDGTAIDLMIDYATAYKRFTERKEYGVCGESCALYNSLGCPYSGFGEINTGKPCDEFRPRRNED